MIETLTGDAAVIREYLFDRLDDEESSRISERLFVDPGFHEAVDATIDQLCDSYLHDRLAPADRAQIAKRALVSPWRERLQFAKALAAEIDSASGSRAPVAAVAAVAEHARRRWRRPANLPLAAAFLVTALGWPLWLAQSRADRLEIANARALAAEATATQRRAEEARDDLRATNLALYPGTRGSELRVELPASAARVRLQVVTEQPLPAGTYVLEIRRDSVAVSSGTFVVAARDPSAIPEVTLGASGVASGEYDVVVFAADDRAHAVRARYVVRVVRQ